MLRPFGLPAWQLVVLAGLVTGSPFPGRVTLPDGEDGKPLPRRAAAEP